MITTRQAAQRLKVTERQVLRYVHAGLLTAQQLGDHPTAPWVITDESLEQLLQARAAQDRQPRRQPANAERSAP